MDIYKRIGIVCNCIPRGQVATYGQIALLCEKPRNSRQVGYALKHGLAGEVPAHRVVNAEPPALRPLICKSFFWKRKESLLHGPQRDGKWISNSLDGKIPWMMFSGFKGSFVQSQSHRKASPLVRLALLSFLSQSLAQLRSFGRSFY